MATIMCPCCGVEISADRPLCWHCSGRPPGTYYVVIPMTDAERRRISPVCPHREDTDG